MLGYHLKAWGRTCGSIFASTLIETLSSVSSPLLQSLEQSPDAESEDPCQELQPEDPTPAQVETYNQFCRSVLDVSQDQIHRMWAEQCFTFSAQDDQWQYSWTGRSGIPLAKFEERWQLLEKKNYELPANALYMSRRPLIDPHPGNASFDASAEVLSLTGGVPLTQLPDDLDPEISKNLHDCTLELAFRLLESCSNDWTQGRNVALVGTLRSFIEGDDRLEFMVTFRQVLPIVQFRWDAGRMADSIIRHFKLPQPSKLPCVLWDQYKWHAEIVDRFPNFRDLESKHYNILLHGDCQPEPQDNQGTPFPRFKWYIVAAIIEVGLPLEESLDLARSIVKYYDRIRNSVLDRVISDSKVRTSSRDWFRTLGRRIRRSMSP